MSAMIWIRIGAIMMAMGVVLGAFGAHSFKARLESTQGTHVWQTAVLYHFIHALGLFVVGWVMMGTQAPLLNISGACMVFGILIFSGSLYTLALGGPSWLGMLTPLGGVLFIVAWLIMAFSIK